MCSQQPEPAQGSSGGGSWLEGINSPLIQNDGDCKQLKLRFDVSQYKPDEIVVKTVDNKLLVGVVGRGVVCGSCGVMGGVVGGVV